MAEFGVVGLSVMGGSLAKNLRDHGVDTAVYSVDAAERDAFRGGSFAVADTLADFCAALSRPRRILMMIYAGAVDSFLGEILPYLEEGDILIDGGNSNYADTERRIALAAERGVRFVGMGVSGGEEGARHGPSLMVGCDEAAWAELSPILCKIAARAEDGTVCCGRVGSGGAGHLTKTVHNGIEYGEMQVIAELCHIMRIGGLPSQTIGQRFALWNRGLLQGYLTEIAAAVLSYEEDGQPLVDRISDVARQKNTGKWASQEALALGCPAPSLFEAVAARLLTEDSMRAHREALYAPARKIILRYIEGHMERAYLAAKTLLYVQGHFSGHGPLPLEGGLHHPLRPAPRADSGRGGGGRFALRPARAGDMRSVHPLSQEGGVCGSRGRRGRPCHGLRPGLFRRPDLRQAPRQRHPGAAGLLRRPRL